MEVAEDVQLLKVPSGLFECRVDLFEGASLIDPVQLTINHVAFGPVERWEGWDQREGGGDAWLDDHESVGGPEWFPSCCLPCLV